jgi:hypothetical protein
VTFFLINCRHFIEEDDKKTLPTEILYHTVNENDAYSVVITNCDKYINPKTLSPKCYTLNPDKTLKKATKGTGYIGNYITVADLKSEPYGLLPKPVMAFCTKQEVYKTLSIDVKAPLNAFKAYINEHPTCLA